MSSRRRFFLEDIIKPIIILVIILAIAATAIYFIYTEWIVRGIDNDPNYQYEYALTEFSVSPEPLRLQKNFNRIILEFDVATNQDAAEEPCLRYVVTKDGIPEITYNFNITENTVVDHIYTQITYYKQKSQIIFLAEYYHDGNQIDRDEQYIDYEIETFSDVFLNTEGDQLTISNLEFETISGKDTPNKTFYLAGFFVIFFICVGVLIAMFPISNAIQESVDCLFHHMSAQIAALGFCATAISLFSYRNPELAARIDREYIKGFFGFGLGLDKLGSSFTITLIITIVGIVLALSLFTHNSRKYRLGFGNGLLVSIVMLFSGICRLIAILSLGLLAIAFLFYLLKSIGTIIGIILLIAFFGYMPHLSPAPASTWSYFTEEKEETPSPKQEQTVKVWRGEGLGKEYLKVSSDGERYYDPEDGEWHRIMK